MIDFDILSRFKIKTMGQSRRERNYVTAKHIIAKPNAGMAVNYAGFKDLNNAVVVTSCWLISYVRHLYWVFFGLFTHYDMKLVQTIYFTRILCL